MPDLSTNDPQDAPQPVAGRSCGSCSLCCKVLRIEEVQTPAGEWCRHCDPGRGCKIHPTRPAACRDFFCLWLMHEKVGPHWVPTKSKIVLCSDGERIAAHVDRSAPGMWRRSPYYEDLKRWAGIAAEQGGQVSVWIGTNIIAILPDRDVDLGVVEDDEVVVSTRKMTMSGPVVHVEKIKRSELAEWQKRWGSAKAVAARDLAGGIVLPGGA